MQDVLHALLFILAAGSMFLALILWEAAYWRRHHAPNAYSLKETLANIVTGVLYKMTDAVVVAVFISIFYDTVRKVGLEYTPSNPWVGYAVLFVATDLLFYGLHIVMHKTRYGWATHITHHSSTRFNFSTALRQNFLFDLTGLALLWWLPLALIGFDKYSVMRVIEINLFYQFFLHTQTIRRLPRWYEAILNTPSHHRVHHGRNPKQIDTNFGGVFILWDRLFGTFVAEKDAGRIAYGITLRQPTSLNPLRLNLDEFFAMWRDVWLDKDLRILWKNPDWKAHSTAKPPAADSS